MALVVPWGFIITDVGVSHVLQQSQINGTQQAY